MPRSSSRRTGPATAADMVEAWARVSMDRWGNKLWNFPIGSGAKERGEERGGTNAVYTAVPHWHTRTLYAGSFLSFFFSFFLSKNSLFLVFLLTLCDKRSTTFN